MVLATLVASAELPERHEEVHVVRANEVLCHADDRAPQCRLAVGEADLLSDVASQLLHRDVRVQLPLEGATEHLALVRHKAIHHTGDHLLHLCPVVEYELLVEQVPVAECRLGAVYGGTVVLACDPLLPVIDAARVEDDVYEVVFLSSAAVLKEQLMPPHVVEVLPGLGGGAAAQTCKAPHLPAIIALGPPGLKLLHGEEATLHVLSPHAHRGCDELAQETGHRQQCREPLLEEVDHQPLQVCPLGVRVRQDADGSVPQAPDVRVDPGGVQREDPHELRDLLALHDLPGAHGLHVPKLPAERKHTVILAPEHAEARNGHCLSRVRPSDDERALLGL
mmetsp:Transcript_97748/g.309975  ORF Transcript_97748/g.309975 Transcript_97748/m.309975 type:complete len:336 (-) Transcript_97748:506-1513(-)